MANEPNNPEEQLKQYGAERRQLVPGEIHPATRNLLQGEVARTYGAAGAAKRKPVRLRWLPALVWIAILGAIPLFLMPRNPETKKEQEILPAKDKEVALPSQSKPGETPIQMSDTPTKVKSPDVAREELAAAAGERDVSVQTASGKNTVTKKTETRQISADAAAPAPVTVAPTTPPPGPVLREEAQLAGSSGNVVMQRARTVEAVPKSETLRVAPQSTPASAVSPAATAQNIQRFSFVNNSATPQALNNFQIEQVGTRFRVVDSDGSVYPGRGSTNGAFHVAGRHNTSKQLVDFTGQVMRASIAISNNRQQQQTPAQQQSTNVASAAQNQNQTYLNNAANNSLSNLSNNSDELRVQGQAVIGRNQYKVDAQETPAQ